MIIKWYSKLKPSKEQDYSMVRSVCEQRAILNNPQDMYEQFLVNDELHDELLDEKLEDFDGDFYEYEERAEYGVDVALAASLPPPDARLSSSKRSNRARKD